VRCPFAIVVVEMLCNGGPGPLVRKCCLNGPEAEEFTLIPASDYLEIQNAEAMSVLPQPRKESELQALADKIKDLEEKLDSKIQQERASPIVVPRVVNEEPIRSFMPRPMPPSKADIPSRIESINEKLREHQARAQPMSSYQAMTSAPKKEPSENKWAEIQGFLGAPEPENGGYSQQTRIPQGDYLLGEAADVDTVTGHDLMNMEQMVSKMAGSPLGCIDFANTFLWRRRNNQLYCLRGHLFEGMAFGEICANYQSITMLAIKRRSALKNAEGRVMWAPQPNVRLQSSDEILLIECAPFVMAKGLGAETTVPSWTTPFSRGDEAQAPGDIFIKNRRCCV